MNRPLPRMTKTASGVLAALLIGIGLSSIAMAHRRVLLSSQREASTQSIHDSAHISATSPIRAVFIGDSYTVGTGGQGVRWTSILTARFGFVEINLGREGTGYMKTSTIRGCGREYCPSYPEMVADAIKARPDVVIVSGGRNDGAATPKAIERTFALLRTSLPETPVLALEPFWDASAPPAWLGLQANAVRKAVEAGGGTYIPVGRPLYGQPALIDRDRIHPNRKGYRALAQAVEESINRKVATSPLPWERP